MPWLQISLECDAEHVEQAESALLESGAISVTLEDAADQPVLEPAPGEMPVWNATRLTGLFEADADLDAVQTRLLQALGLSRLPRLKIETLEEREWEKEWMDRFQPMRFGDNLWICPSWHTPPESGAVTIMLDPGLAFGTGTHPTTALCLEWLDRHPPEGRQVIDYGCGSGILAIAALKLGAEKVIATDIDPQALEATEANARKNGIDPDRLITVLPDQVPQIPADLVMANILSGPLVELEPTLAGLTRPGGQLILSGILEDQADNVREAYERDFELAPTRTQEEWVRIEGQRR